MEVNNAKTGGSLQISTDAIAKIAKMAMLEIDGAMAVECGQTGFKKLLFGNVPYAPNPITVELVDGIAEITVNVKVRYGCKIPALAEKVQQNIKSSIQNMTCITVSKVNVIVAGVAGESEAAQ